MAPPKDITPYMTQSTLFSFLHFKALLSLPVLLHVTKTKLHDDIEGRGMIFMKSRYCLGALKTDIRRSLPKMSCCKF